MLASIGNYSAYTQIQESSQSVQTPAADDSISASDSYMSALNHANRAIEEKLFSPDGNWRISCDSDHTLWMGPMEKGCVLWEIGKTLDHGRIVFSSDSKWLAWQSEDGNIAYRPVTANLEESDTRFVESVNKKFTFSADNQHLFILPEQYEYTQEQRTALSEAQKDLAIFQSIYNFHTSPLRNAMITLLGIEGIIATTVVAAPLFFAAGPAVLSIAIISKLSAGSIVMGLSLYSKLDTNKKTKRAQELLQEQRKSVKKKSQLLMEIELLSLQSNTITSKIKMNACNEVSRLIFSDNKKYLFTLEKEKIIRKWDIQTGTSENMPIISDMPISDIIPSPSGKWLALTNFSIQDANQIQIYSTTEQPAVISQFKIASEKIANFSFSRDERWFAVLEKYDQIILFSNELGTYKKIENILPGTAHAIYWPKEKDILITIGEDHNIQAWNIILNNGISFEIQQLENQNLPQKILDQSRRKSYLNYMPITPHLGKH